MESSLEQESVSCDHFSCHPLLWSNIQDLSLGHAVQMLYFIITDHTVHIIT